MNLNRDGSTEFVYDNDFTQPVDQDFLTDKHMTEISTPENQEGENDSSN